MLLEVECFLYNKHLDELGVKTTDEVSLMLMNTKDISFHRQVIEDGDDKISKTQCMIYFKCGESILINRSYDDISKLRFKEF